jgi:hypothetical protein
VQLQEQPQPPAERSKRLRRPRRPRSLRVWRILSHRSTSRSEAPRAATTLQRCVTPRFASARAAVTGDQQQAAGCAQSGRRRSRESPGQQHRQAVESAKRPATEARRSCCKDREQLSPPSQPPSSWHPATPCGVRERTQPTRLGSPRAAGHLCRFQHFLAEPVLERHLQSLIYPHQGSQGA